MKQQKIDEFFQLITAKAAELGWYVVVPDTKVVNSFFIGTKEELNEIAILLAEHPQWENADVYELPEKEEDGVH